MQKTTSTFRKIDVELSILKHFLHQFLEKPMLNVLTTSVLDKTDVENVYVIKTLPTSVLD